MHSLLRRVVLLLPLLLFMLPMSAQSKADSGLISRFAIVQVHPEYLDAYLQAAGEVGLPRYVPNQGSYVSIPYK